MLTQTPQTAVSCDVEPFHDLARTNCAHSRQCLQDIDDLGVGNDIVRLSKVQHLGKAALAGAQSLLHLGAAASSLGRGMPCLLALLIAQGGNRHSSRPHLAARYLDPPIRGESVGGLRTYLNSMTAFI
jgi:hypothetical protein